LAFACSELYLDRIKINSEEAPASELIKNSNLKNITGAAALVDFNADFMRERAERVTTDANIDWLTDTYVSAVITGNSIDIDDPVIASGPLFAASDPYTYIENEVILVKIVLTDDSGDDSATLPLVNFDGADLRLKEWGTNWLSYRMNAAGSDNVTIKHQNGEKAVLTAVITVYSFV